MKIFFFIILFFQNFFIIFHNNPKWHGHLQCFKSDYSSKVDQVGRIGVTQVFLTSFSSSSFLFFKILKNFKRMKYGTKVLSSMKCLVILKMKLEGVKKSVRDCSLYRCKIIPCFLPKTPKNLQKWVSETHYSENFSFLNGFFKLSFHFIFLQKFKIFFVKKILFFRNFAFGWLIDWLIEWIIDWLIDWLIDWFCFEIHFL